MGQQPITINLDLPADIAYLSVAGECVAELLRHTEDLVESETVMYEVQTAVQEIAVNIIKHAYRHAPGKRIALSFSLMPDPVRMVIELRDHGRSFDLAAVPPPDLTQPQTQGYGLFLARKMLDELTYEHTPKGNHWVLTKDLKTRTTSP